MALLYPLINGNRYDWSSVEIRLASRRYVGVSEANYTDSLEPGKVRGTLSQKLGRTRGQNDPEGSISVFREEWGDILLALPQLAPGAGIMEVNFDIAVMYSEAIVGVQTDQLLGCRIKKIDNSHKQGNEPLSVKLDLDIMAIIHNGVPAVSGLVR